MTSSGSVSGTSNTSTCLSFPNSLPGICDPSFGYVGGRAQTTYSSFAQAFDCNVAPYCNLAAIIDITSGGGYQFSYPFTYGYPFMLQQEVLVNETLSVTTSNTIGTNGQITADYFDPTWISQISITDADGNPVNGWTITSGSGLIYSANGVSAAPEPANFGLVLLGAAALVLCFYRKQRVSRR